MEILFLSTLFVCFITTLYLILKFADVNPLQTMFSLGIFGSVYFLFHVIGSFEWGSFVLHVLLIGPFVALSIVYLSYHIYGVVAHGRSPSIRIFLDATLGSLIAYYVFHWLITAYISFSVPENNFKHNVLRSWRDWPTYYEIRDYKEPINTLTSTHTFSKDTWMDDWYHQFDPKIKQYIDKHKTSENPLSHYNNRTVVLLHPKRGSNEASTWRGDNTQEGAELSAGALLYSLTNTKDLPNGLKQQQHNVQKTLSIKEYDVSAVDFTEEDFEERLLSALEKIDKNENLNGYDIDTTYPVMMVTTLASERLSQDTLALFKWRYKVDIEFIVPLSEKKVGTDD